MVGQLGFEPRTRGLKGPCSNQLSYRPKSIGLVNYTEIELKRQSNLVVATVFFLEQWSDQRGERKAGHEIKVELA